MTFTKSDGEVELLNRDCWCYAMKKQVNVKGKIVGKRVCLLLKIVDCYHKKCPKRYADDCLIGKIREGRW